MSNEIQFLLYNMPDAEGSVQVVIRDETLWCTQKTIKELIDFYSLDAIIAVGYRVSSLKATRFRQWAV